jgi:Protein of unknown function (DUF 659)/hAT family C-terminal dimerisation region
VLRLDSVYGYTIASDGFTDTSHRPLFNFIINTATSAMFHSTAEGGSGMKTAAAVAELFHPLMEEHGRKVTAITTDSAAVMKAAGRLLEVRYPWVTWIPCAAHQVDLVMKKICKLPAFARVITNMRAVVVWMRRHQVPLAVYRQRCNLSLSIPGATRFGSTVLCLERLTSQEVLKAAQCVFTADDFQTWVKQQNKQQRLKARKAQSILSNQEQLATAKMLVQLLQPCMNVLRLFDRDMPVSGFVYKAMLDLRTSAAKILQQRQYKVAAADQERVLAVIDSQSQVMIYDLHRAAYAVNPRYVQDVRQLLQPDESGMITQDASRLKKAVQTMLNKLCPSADMAATALHQFNHVYVVGRGAYAGEQFTAAAQNSSIAPHQMWVDYEADAPELAAVARKLLAVWPHATPCERNWKDTNNQHTKTRNRLSKKRVEQLVYCSSNRRQLKRRRLLDDKAYEWVGAGKDVGDDSDGEDVSEVDGFPVDENGEGDLYEADEGLEMLEAEDLPASVLDMHAEEWMDDEPEFALE